MAKRNPPVWDFSGDVRDQAVSFIVIIALVGAVLGIAVSFDPEIPPLQRAIADQSSFVLNLAGVDSEVYYYWVTVSTLAMPEDKRVALKEKFAALSLVYREESASIDFYGNAPDKPKGETIEEYVHALRAEGIEARFEPATIVTPAMDISIVPGCTGWLGIAAILALILAYPKTTWRSRFYGFIMAIGLMYALNILRLVSAIWAANTMGVWTWPYLEPLLWRWGMLAAALVLWIFWIKFIAERE